MTKRKERKNYIGFHMEGKKMRWSLERIAREEER